MKNNIYYDILTRVNILNSYNNNIVKYDFASTQNIKIDDIKIILSNTVLYNKYKLNVLNNTFKFISFINTELIFKYYNNNVKLLYYCRFYNIKTDITNISSKINNDLIFTYLLSKLFLMHRVNHLQLSIMNIDMLFSDIEQLNIDEVSNKKIHDLISTNKIYNICSVQIKECYKNLYKLDEYVINNNIDFKILLFQIIYILAFIQNKYKDFRHNNLILNNINISIIEETNITYKGFNNDNFNINNTNFLLKLSKFDNSIIPNKYGHSNINNKYIKFSDKVNPYYDIYIFLSSLVKILNKNKIVLDDKTNIFINKYLPHNIRNEFNNEIIAIPKDILYDEYFSNLLKDSTRNTYSCRKLIKDDKNYKKLNRIKGTINMVGGSATIPPYKEKLNPFLSNDQKEGYKQDFTDRESRQPPLLLEQKIYDNSKTKQEIPTSNIPINFANQLGPYGQYQQYQQPLQKIYNISLSNPLGNYQIINEIYEDQLPRRLSGTGNYTAISLFERSQLIDFIRNIMIEVKDGEDMTITGGKNSFLSYIKLLDINPYTNGHPYENLSQNFLLYRAAYPIRLDMKSKNVKISKNSMGLNVRLYMMTMGDINCRKINYIDADNFDLWRELKYYDWIKSNVCKQKVSPNFITPILYKIDTESKINWDKLEELKNKNKPQDVVKKLIINQKHVNDVHDEQSLFNVPTYNNKADITKNINKVLVLLTESPTTSIIQWSSPLYSLHGSVRKMISTGYHSPDVWNSILFQLIYALTVLYEKGICFENFNLANNVYIKDIDYDANAIGSWIYKLDDIEYYIPNYGYILMIDSKYADINIDTSLLPVDSKHQVFKIHGSLYKNNSNFSSSQIKDKIMDQFKHIIDPDNFNHLFRMNKGAIPDKTVLDLLKLIHDDNKKDSMKYYLHTYFKKYLHNRIGTLLTKFEKENVNTITIPNFDTYKGKLLVYQKRYQEFVWVLYVDNINQFSCNVITLEPNNSIYTTINVNKTSLHELLGNEKIIPDSSKNMIFNESYIYETYNIDNLI